MKITKYAQSCFLIETKGKRILIDPGNLNDFKPEDWKEIDILLLTHRHHDHCLPETVKVIVENNKVEILCNSEVAEMLEGIKVMVMEESDKKDFDGIEIEMTKAIHGYLPAMKDTGYPKESNGFIIRDGKTSVYHCGDTLSFEHNYKADVVLVPICGHAVVMEPLVAIEFGEEMGAKLIIPMHYDSDKHQMGTEEFERLAKEKGINYKILKNGESIEI
ncbi:MAG: MBL fold metallo-hydrolase [Nanoarchaeota archaeon]|nr:MBL fold metallo-hydrolase [Nanoarchaeota archaeon]